MVIPEQRVYNSSGLPFDKCLAKNIVALNDRVKSKKASLIVIEGGLGEGKTTLVAHILDYINELNGLPIIEMEGPQMAMGGASFQKKIRDCYDSELPCIGYDESGDFSKRQALSAFNAMMNRTFETFRVFKCIVVMALPTFASLDNSLMDKGIPRLLLRLNDRTSYQGNYSGYSLYRMHLLRQKMGKANCIKPFAYSQVHPNFVGHFLNLDPKRCAEMDNISSVNKLDTLRSQEVKMEGLISLPDVAVKLDRSTRWVYNAVNELNLKPNRIIKKKQYFDGNSVDKLFDMVDKNERRGR